MDRDRTLQFVPMTIDLPPGTVVTAGTGEILRVEGVTESQLNVTLEAMPTYFECNIEHLQSLENALRQGYAMATMVPY